ncbi:hypothetical protein J45TS6_19610 [Paenibacillus sp. J45TS6]|uniref:DUF1854 domain-containing protein n=1 Tax=Paenibacillus sp. J45TS6 TaxID=2807196 RepID=UPI001B0BA1FE|nr:DUF1854 domain-containing protein [Paenibacillus sp. J45TS6]GIP43502.1 hypothetical protein J45TS6_19610 [Paenibacillus sp. J45TS6]
MAEHFDIQLLRQQDINLSRNKGGVIQGTVNEKYYDELIVYRCFPFQYDSSYISIRNAEDEELGIVREIEELDKESACVLKEELELRYFLPKVTHIDSVKNKSGLWLWELQTNLGPTRMVMRNLHEHLLYPGEGWIIITDMNGKRCEIKDWRMLDSHSQKQLQEII